MPAYPIALCFQFYAYFGRLTLGRTDPFHPEPFPILPPVFLESHCYANR